MTKKSGEERRRARRTVVLESFNLFLVVPELFGMSRIYLRDLSAVGLSFRSELEIPVKSGQKFQARLYLNPAFYLPLDCRVVRASTGEVAVDFESPTAGAAQALGRLQDFLELAVDHGVLVE